MWARNRKKPGLPGKRYITNSMRAWVGKSSVLPGNNLITCSMHARVGEFWAAMKKVQRYSIGSRVDKITVLP